MKRYNCTYLLLVISDEYYIILRYCRLIPHSSRWEPIKSNLRSYSFAYRACEKVKLQSHASRNDASILQAYWLCSSFSSEYKTHEFAIIYHGSCVGKVMRTMINECQIDTNLLSVLLFSKPRRRRFLGFFLSFINIRCRNSLYYLLITF